MFVEQSHQSAMPSPVWLHVNGISLPADVQQFHSSSHVYDYRTKHLQSPSQPSTPRMTPASNTIVPYNITIIDGPFQQTKRQHQKLENLEMSKRMYMDRQLRKAKSLPGLIKGTAFSRQAPLQSASFIYPMPPNSSVDSSTHDMMLPASSFHQHDESLPLSGSGEQSSDGRRPRVYFADFNKIEFVEDKKDNVQQRLPNNSVPRRHRHRLIKKSSSMNASIQQSQSVENFSRSLSRQQYLLSGQEFNVKKQPLNTTTRTQPVHNTTVFPDIVNTSLPRDTAINDNASGKNLLTRDKTLSRLRKVAIDLPINISLDVSRDHTRPKRAHSSSVRDGQNQVQLSELADQETGAGPPRRSSIVSSSFNNRHRPTNRTVPLRQQFITPFKTDANQYQSQQSHYPNSSSMNVRRSASLKHANARLQDDLEDVSVDELLSINNRSMATRAESAKGLKRGHVHFNSKTSLTTPAATETHEIHRQPSRATARKTSQERFQNLLTIVRPPYITGTHGLSSMPVNDFATSTGNSTNPTPIGIGRSIRRTSAQGPLVFHITSNTIVV